jgi:putative addiction module CopG family antidote
MAHHITTMSISLPKQLQEYIKKRTKDAHYSTVSDYVRSLIRDDIKRFEQEYLEQELLKGVQSKSRTMTPKAWEKLKKEILGSAKR